MVIQELIDFVDKSAANEVGYINLWEIVEEVGLQPDYIEDCCDRFKAYTLYKSYCTDTHVGGILYFLDNKFVFATIQKYRKSRPVFLWKGDNSFAEVREYILSLCDTPEEIINFLDPDEEMGLGVPFISASQVLGDELVFVKTSDLVKVLDKSTKDSEILVELNSGKTSCVSVDELLIPYQVEKGFYGQEKKD